MRVVAAGLTLTPERCAAAGVEFRTIDDLFRESDVISIHMKLADATRGLVDARLLSLMKPDAVLVNTSRGPIVDEAALVSALQEHRIGGTALDVYDAEPLPADHPLRKTDNTLLLAHCGWPTDEGYSRMIPETVAVIEAFLDGKPVNVENAVAAAR
jgi:phosphoglycerate dehydrogenase-like enzyme